jgi:hypothetical protein
MTALFEELEQIPAIPQRELVTEEIIQRNKEALVQFFNTEEGKAVWRGAFFTFINARTQPPLQAAGIIAT